MRLQGLSMSHEEHLVLRSVCPRVAEKLEESIACVLRENTLGNRVQMQTTASRGRQRELRNGDDVKRAEAAACQQQYLYAAPLTLHTAVTMD